MDRIFEDLPEGQETVAKEEKEDAKENEGNCEFINYNEILEFAGAWTISRYETHSLLRYLMMMKLKCWTLV
jgi:hypothetical protein